MFNFDNEILQLVYKFDGYGIMLYVFITSSIAGVLAFFVGLERQIRGKTTNLKTHVLLAVGCSLLMTISIWAIRIADGSINIIVGPDSVSAKLSYDTSRIAAGVVTGMGFLGGGAIIKDKFSIRGLSTAATLWISAAIGLACGSGFLVESLIITALVIVLLIFINWINKTFEKKSDYIEIITPNSFPLIKTVNELANENDVQIRTIKIIDVNDTETVSRITFHLSYTEPQLLYFKNQLLNISELKIKDIYYK